MPDQRIIASVTWGKCPVGRPHLGEVVLFEGAQVSAWDVMHQHHHTMWKEREFKCMRCGATAKLVPMAVMVEDVRKPPRRF